MTINVVTKRGTNEIQGAARYLYASGNWQSTNTPQEAIDQGLQTNDTRMIRDYGADFGGPIIKDKLWLWFAGAYQTISTNHDGVQHEGRDVSALDREPRALEREAELADLQRQLGAALLPAQLPRPVQHEHRADPSALAATQLTIPTNFYKVEDSHVFSVGLLRLDLRGLSEPRLHGYRQRLHGCANIPFQVVCAGDTTRDAY